MRLRILSALPCTLIGVIALRSPMLAQGQTRPAKTLDVGLMYSTQVTNYVAAQKFWMQGGSVDAAYPITQQFSAAMNFSGLHGHGDQVADVSLSTLTFAAGPRYTHPFGRRSKLFGEALFGVTHGFDSVFPTSTGHTATANAFALQAGGGYDLQWKKHIALRIPAIDYVRTALPNGTTNVQNVLRISAGLVWELPAAGLRRGAKPPL